MLAGIGNLLMESNEPEAQEGRGKRTEACT